MEHSSLQSGFAVKIDVIWESEYIQGPQSLMWRVLPRFAITRGQSIIFLSMWMSKSGLSVGHAV
jgi:hypothetical protein